MGATAYSLMALPLADDPEWMSGKSRNRLAPVLTEASSWSSDRSGATVGVSMHGLHVTCVSVGSVGMARRWHFLSVQFRVGNGPGLRSRVLRDWATEAAGADALVGRA